MGKMEVRSDVELRNVGTLKCDYYRYFTGDGFEYSWCKYRVVSKTRGVVKHFVLSSVLNTF